MGKWLKGLILLGKVEVGAGEGNRTLVSRRHRLPPFRSARRRIETACNQETARQDLLHEERPGKTVEAVSTGFFRSKVARLWRIFGGHPTVGEL